MERATALNDSVPYSLLDHPTSRGNDISYWRIAPWSHCIIAWYLVFIVRDLREAMQSSDFFLPLWNPLSGESTSPNIYTYYLHSCILCISLRNTGTPATGLEPRTRHDLRHHLSGQWVRGAAVGRGAAQSRPGVPSGIPAADETRAVSKQWVSSDHRINQPNAIVFQWPLT